MRITEDQYKQMQGRVRSGATGVRNWIGIDPGRHTGIAIWDSHKQEFFRVESMKPVEAEGVILDVVGISHYTGYPHHVVVEDTRNLRLPAKLQNAGRLKGVGAVHAEMHRWQEFLTHHNIPHTMAGLSPKEFREGNDAWFRAKTGWDKRSNEHGRCAAGLVYLR